MIRFLTKIYKYDSSKESDNYRGENYSRNILIGDSSIDNLDDTLDTYEITLTGLTFREEFDPTTKFIIEKWQEQTDDEGNTLSQTLWRTWHLCVSSDAVSQPILSDNNYFDHHLSLIEAGVEAQQRLIDNISVTYKLQDVTIDKIPTYDTNATLNVNIQNAYKKPYEETYGTHSGFLYSQEITGHMFEWIMPNYYTVNIDGKDVVPSWDIWNSFKLNQTIPYGDSTKNVQLPIPMLKCWGWEDNTYALSNFNCFCSIDVIVTESLNNVLQRTITYQVNPSSTLNDENHFSTDPAMVKLFERYFGHIVSRLNPNFYVSKVATKGSSLNGIPNKTEEFTTLLNRVLTITIKPNYTYNITLRRHVFDNYDFTQSDINVYGDGLTYNYDKYPYLYYNWFVKGFVTDEYGTSTNDNNPAVKTLFNVFLQGEQGKIIFQSAPPATAYDLFNKAQLTSQTNLKNINYIVDETPKAFYLNDEDKQQLQNTKIIESFFNQYNEWQILMDIGKYIHARPVVTFGSNNRFLVSWKKYGQTKQYDDLAEPISVFNSRFIEEYISACSSYITNMVQLGGEITETVAPKSSSENYLVYNDVAEIIVTKPIIEILNLDVIRKSDNESRNLTGNGIWGESDVGYVFEKGVYNLLSINKDDSVNKGMAIYYELGTNKIVGLNYRLPMTNTGEVENDYAIKKIIGTVFRITQSDWKQIKVNDYVFKITYRTKDTLRSNQTRPDIRKYLLSTKFDRVPLHNQFNNQQDIVVDSVKFGNNIYGKLIRTGNTVYSKIEWVDRPEYLKQSGQLYNIYGNIYYVSKVKNTYYPNHIISEVEFSKDFNRLSQIIGIPSEPRFYEISEQSLINREVSVDDYLCVDTEIKTTSGDNSFVKGNGWNYIDSLLFKNELSYPQYAITIFKDDIKKGNGDFKAETLHPVSTYSIQNTLTIEWDMVDNFSAGDQVKETSYSLDNTTDSAYNTLIPFAYTNKFGRVDMFDFAILKETTLTPSQVLLLPENQINLNSPTEETSNNYLFGNNNLGNFGTQNNGIILLKDNREVIKMNYNIQLITGSDRFVLSSYIWQNQKQNLKLALLNEEVNKISNDTIENNLFQVENIPFETEVSTINNNIRIKISSALADYDLTKYKSIAIYSTNLINDYVNSGAKYFVIARNIGGLTDEEAKADWYISNFNKSMFKKQ